MTALLEVRDLKVSFRRGRRTTYAVNGVSFDLDRGQTLGVVGESGSGKSVTALAVARLLPERTARVSGQIRFDGKDLLTASESEIRSIHGGDIGMIFQDPMTALNPVLTIERQLTEPLQVHRSLSRRKARARAMDALELVGIPDPQHRIEGYPHQFSGGMRQRVMIAMAIICEPALLIADEPTTALDVTIQAQIIELLAGLHTELGMAVMWISHDLGVVAGFCRDANVMYAGKLMETGSVDDLFASTRHPYTLGLLESIPRLDGDVGQLLRPIPGQPPDLSALPSGCPFSPRCRFVVERCEEQEPPLADVNDGTDTTATSGTHSAACWINLAGRRSAMSAERSAS